jgi:hypothetical protein
LCDGSAFTVGEATVVGLASVGTGATVGFGVGVEGLPLDANRQGSLSLSLTSRDPAILVVSGTAPFTTAETSFGPEIK